MKITVVGAGYVGLSVAALLSRRNDVTLVEINPDRVDQINNGICPIKDSMLEEALVRAPIHAVSDPSGVYAVSDVVVVATPTDYDSEKHYFNTSSVESVIAKAVRQNPEALIVIKSTIPVGFTKQMCERFATTNIVFCPEFLREGHALEDNLYPSRIILGKETPDVTALQEGFINEMAMCAIKDDVEVLTMGSGEAESVKLFANTYLALRISYFNELDSYAYANGLNPEQIIRGVCLDPRIGDGYT